MTLQDKRQREHGLATKFECKCGFRTDFIQVLSYHLQYPNREITVERLKLLVK